ncbi:uncharacterized protein PRCAT00001856001 [Priceomyces carsonii]|uniref:uncharacterized protein n=1 Tax=Priceomyces carsonii TaxID=28549 RepID=UPI002ED9A28E|nr:unnamed protein product [Priceomyces carsonii]
MNLESQFLEGGNMNHSYIYQNNESLNESVFDDEILDFSGSSFGELGSSDSILEPKIEELRSSGSTTLHKSDLASGIIEHIPNSSTSKDIPLHFTKVDYDYSDCTTFDRRRLFRDGNSVLGAIFSCPLCTRVFDDCNIYMLHLKMHMMKLKTDESRDESCEMHKDEDISLESIYERLKKLKIKQLNPLPLFKCKSCAKRFTSKIRLSFHFSVHTRQKMDTYIQEIYS